MAAEGISIFTLAFTNPNVSVTDVSTTRVKSAFDFPLPGTNVITLTESGRMPGDDIEGLMYVPDLVKNSKCFNESAPFVPSNVTRTSDLPANDELPFIAVAPWTNSSDCAKEYLDAAAKRYEIDALIFWRPADLDNTTGPNDLTPPSRSNSVWEIDGNFNWKNDYPFPVYAVNAQNGKLILNELALYSGALKDAPDASTVLDSFPDTDLVRIYALIDTGRPDSLPSLWVFLLIVLGLIIAMIGVTSMIMHWIQRRRRFALRDRIIAGEVDIESLGIRRLNIPQPMIEKMPLYVWVTSEPQSPTADSAANKEKPADGQSPSSSVEIAKGSAEPPPTDPAEENANLPPISSLPAKQFSYSQSSCPICIDDYSNGQTIVRELPCKHIFHPACIDPVLKEYSSLCPICKASCLPKGYCPQVTNIMVRRERGLRRMRDMDTNPQRFRNMRLATLAARGGSVDSGGGHHYPPPPPPARSPQHRRTGRTFHHLFGRGAPSRHSNHEADAAADAPVSSPQQQQQPAVESVEMQPVSPTPAPPAAVAGPSAGADGGALQASESAHRPANVSREEWARQRAEALVGRDTTVEEQVQQQERQRPKWRKALGTVFPVFQ